MQAQARQVPGGVVVGGGRDVVNVGVGRDVLVVVGVGDGVLETVVFVPGVPLGGIVVLAVLVGCSVGAGVERVVDTGREVVDVGVVRDVLVAVGVGDGVLETVVVVPRVPLGGIVVLAVLVGCSVGVGVGRVVDTAVVDTVLTVGVGEVATVLAVLTVIHSGLLGMQQTLIS